MSKILKTIVAAFEEADIAASKKASLLKLLTVFCKCKDKLVRQNQQDLIIYMTEYTSRSSILYLFTNEGFSELYSLINGCKEIQILENIINEECIAGPSIIVS